MKQFSNRYILIYSAVLVAIVALVLTVVSVSLKPLQTHNQQVEQMQMVLKAAGIESSSDEAEALYGKHIVEAHTAEGLPYYTFSDGVILPLKGNGLWGPIWGYLALDSDWVIVGAVFDHKGETPGLGGEISTDKFAKRFIGKHILDEQGRILPPVLQKHADPKDLHHVDAISGGTMTSNGVTAMLANDIIQYESIIYEQ